MRQLKKRRFLVLLEIMIALLILGILTVGISKTARNAMDMARYRKSLDQAAQIQAALENHLFEKGESVDSVLNRWRQIASASPLVGGNQMLKDGWGYDFECHLASSQHEMVKAALRSYLDASDLGRFVLVSQGLNSYQKKRYRAPTAL